MLRHLIFATMIPAIAVVSVSPAAAIGVEDLIQQLDAEKFADRRAASQQLQEMGKSVFPALAEAAKSRSREVSARAFAILKHHFANSESETRAAAEAVLKGLSDSADPSLAHRAAQALRPPEEPDNPPSAPRAIPFQPGQIQIQIQVQAVQGGNRIQIQMRNGVKDIEAEENGQKVKIHEGPDGIKVEITDKNGATKKYAAKDADDLKKRHPDGHKIYKKYEQNQGGIQIRAAGLQRRQLPVPPIPLNRAKGIEQSKQHVDKMIERFRKRIVDDRQNAERYRRMIESLEKHKKQFDEISKRIDGGP